MSSIVKEKSMSFAVRIVKLYKYLCEEKHEYVLSKQIVRSGTSIGANICEVCSGQSRRDFLAKMSIALSEANETEYWLEIMKRSGILTEKEYNRIIGDCREIIKMLTSSVKTIRKEEGRK